MRLRHAGWRRREGLRKPLVADIADDDALRVERVVPRGADVSGIKWRQVRVQERLLRSRRNQLHVSRPVGSRRPGLAAIDAQLSKDIEETANAEGSVRLRLDANTAAGRQGGTLAHHHSRRQI